MRALRDAAANDRVKLFVAGMLAGAIRAPLERGDPIDESAYAFWRDRGLELASLVERVESATMEQVEVSIVHLLGALYPASGKFH